MPSSDEQPVCRTCYINSRPESEAERIRQEPITMPVHYCPTHKKVQDELNEMLNRLPFPLVHEKKSTDGKFEFQRSRTW